YDLAQDYDEPPRPPSVPQRNIGDADARGDVEPDAERGLAPALPSARRHVRTVGPRSGGPVAGQVRWSPSCAARATGRQGIDARGAQVRGQGDRADPRAEGGRPVWRARRAPADHGDG